MFRPLRGNRVLRVLLVDFLGSANADQAGGRSPCSHKPDDDDRLSRRTHPDSPRAPPCRQRGAPFVLEKLPVFVGDAMEEAIDDLCADAGELGLMGVKAFMFNQGHAQPLQRVPRDCQADRAAAPMRVLMPVPTPCAILSASWRWRMRQEGSTACSKSPAGARWCGASSFTKGARDDVDLRRGRARTRLVGRRTSSPRRMPQPWPRPSKSSAIWLAAPPCSLVCGGALTWRSYSKCWTWLWAGCLPSAGIRAPRTAHAGQRVPGSHGHDRDGARPRQRKHGWDRAGRQLDWSTAGLRRAAPNSSTMSAKPPIPTVYRLLEAYLTAGFPAGVKTLRAMATRGRAPKPSGAMTKEEAYQILGLQPGASLDEIRRGASTLMKKLHPDQGGTAHLAARWLPGQRSPAGPTSLILHARSGLSFYAATA